MSLLLQLLLQHTLLSAAAPVSVHSTPMYYMGGCILNVPTYPVVLVQRLPPLPPPARGGANSVSIVPLSVSLSLSTFLYRLAYYHTCDTGAFLAEKRAGLARHLCTSVHDDDDETHWHGMA